jgi:3-oxoacyl-[acyl-carrier-protein] synthase II
MSRRRVVVTGLGCVSPVGNTVAEAWAISSPVNPASASSPGSMRRTFACKIAGEVKGFDLESYISAKEARTMDTFIHYGIAAAHQAVSIRVCPRATHWMKSWPSASAASSARASAACR